MQNKITTQERIRRESVLRLVFCGFFILLANFEAFSQWAENTTQIYNSPQKPVSVSVGTTSSITTALSLYTNGDPNFGIKLLTGPGDGAGYSGWNGGIGSWYGIGFHSTLDGVTRGVFNVRDGSFSMRGNLSIGYDDASVLIGGPAFSGAIQIRTHSALSGHDKRYLRLGYKDNNGIFNPALSITDELRVGIGTTNPTERMRISGAEANSPSLVIQNTSFSGDNNQGQVSMQFAFANHTGPKIEAYKTGINTTGLKLYTEYGFNVSSLAMTFKPIGANVHLVGIGTSDPTAGLDMRGNLVLRNYENATSAGSSIHFTSYDISHPGPMIRSNLHLANGVNSNSALILSSYVGSYKNEMTVHNGRVGINTSDPDEALTVKGKIHTSEVRVDTDPRVFPDYVFKKDYELMTLKEVEAFIQVNKRLPEVPSADEIGESGMNLKEMNLILLKKVEELTLHIIELEKKNDLLNAQLSAVDTLNKQVAAIEKQLKKLSK